MTTPLTLDDIQALVEAIPDLTWRYAFQPRPAYGYAKVFSRGKTVPRPPRLLSRGPWAAAWNFEASYRADRLPPMKPGPGSDAMGVYMRRRHEEKGEKLVLYSCRHASEYRAYTLCPMLPTKFLVCRVSKSAPRNPLESPVTPYYRTQTRGVFPLFPAAAQGASKICQVLGNPPFQALLS